MTPEPSLSLTAPSTDLSVTERVGVAFVVCGFAAFAVALGGAGYVAPLALLLTGMGGLTAGTIMLAWRYLRRPAGVDNDGVWQSSNTGRGLFGWALAVAMTLFYVLLYWWPDTLGGLIRTFDPLSEALRGRAADQWFMYGTFYTLAILVMGARALAKYRHTRYQVIRTISVMVVQLGFAFLLPIVFIVMQEPEMYLSYFWPLDYDYIWPSNIAYLSGARLGTFFIFWGLVLSFVATPILTYFFGKRWYCSWVCGCGGLAETMGDPYRQLSSKKVRAWQVERWMIHSVLVFIVATTALVWVNAAMDNAILGKLSHGVSRTYGFLIGSVFAGVVGVGFYPIMGSRVWCRYGCPMAAILGLQQRFFSRFRITTNGGQCISCGNCSTYCEMGIDVKWYAQRGQNVIRASCVGCGICATVCPRGVLKLENGPREDRYNGQTLFPEASLDILPD